ncbi:MAG: c-type cytochrome [Polyangiaceae bacterium]|nr:c-type cytochrome [Polyangiaceae bacterium]MCL4751999.1 c-type cytochrome [Myxococcales bacterium]
MSEASEKPSPAAPKSDEEMLMDHEYDGIQEYDNPLPRWWVWIFWGSTVWAAVYYVVYHVTGSVPGVIASYDAEVKAAGASAPKAVTQTEDSLGKAMNDATTVAAGKAVYALRCAACHADKGQGLVGPNLTDKHWVHGEGKLLDIHKVVSEGVAAKGMPAWEKQLTPAELTQVVAYVGTLRGKMETGKAPEGKEVTGN